MADLIVAPELEGINAAIAAYRCVQQFSLRPRTRSLDHSGSRDSGKRNSFLIFGLVGLA
jgi:hypothetical protein